MAAVSRARDPQRLVELVADTMHRERTRADRARALSGSAAGQSPAAPAEVNDDLKRAD